MAVYVDPAIHPYRRMIMCHMWADTLDELHAFADCLGLKCAWFQQPPAVSWCHYDLSKTTRARAIALGAVPTDKFGALEFVARLTGDERRLALIARCRVLRSQPQGRLGFDLTRAAS